MSVPSRLSRLPSQAARSPTVGRSRAHLSDRPSLRNTRCCLPSPNRTASKNLTTLQEANSRNLPDVWFNQTFPLAGASGPQRPGTQPPGDNKVKLGKTLRILQERLPTLLQSPLPQEILSPHISLHLFPSTHPHLPVVSGRVAYTAALWTSPIAWNRVPLVGNLALEILSERMVRGRAARREGALDEQLVVRWRSIGGRGADRRPGLPGSAEAQAARGRKVGFTGLFIFEFDAEGRILGHTIEHVQEGGNWENGVGAKVVGLTDWLLGGMRGGRDEPDTPCPAFARKGR